MKVLLIAAFLFTIVPASIIVGFFFGYNKGYNDGYIDNQSHVQLRKAFGL